MGRKTTARIFQATNWQNLIEEDLNITTKENIKRETESLQIAMENNVIRTNYIKVQINNTQQKSKRILCFNRDINKPLIRKIRQTSVKGV